MIKYKIECASVFKKDVFYPFSHEEFDPRNVKYVLEELECLRRFNKHMIFRAVELTPVTDYIINVKSW